MFVSEQNSDTIEFVKRIFLCLHIIRNHSYNIFKMFLIWFLEHSLDGHILTKNVYNVEIIFKTCVCYLGIIFSN